MSEEECFELFRELRKVAARLSHERDNDLKVLGLTSNQSTALLFIHYHPGCQISDIGNHLDTSHQAARTLVERMSTKGLLVVEASDTDGRAKSIRLSDEGERKFRKILEVGGHTAANSLSVLSQDERRMLDKLLRKISNNPFL